MKNAESEYPVHELIGKRWSPYVFADRAVPRDDLRSLFEAARWTMSSYNAQPWRYIVGILGYSDALRDQVFSVLLEGNQAWAGRAPVLALGLVEHNFEHNGKPNKAAVHDLGAASAQLTLEATARGLCVHQMVGIDPDKAREVFDLPDSIEPFTGLAIGYPGKAEDADEEFASRDSRPRVRKPMQDIFLAGFDFLIPG
ncbi:MAG: nitroreductase family protein [Gammaproteobacteria bacterium]|nr:nitroreductase family protein [Gammaproteobacteria bacterium]